MQCRGYACLVAFVTSATLFFTQTLKAQLPVATGPTVMVPVQGHMMRVRVARLADRQQGRPVVVLQSDALQSIDTWGPIFNRVAVPTPVIAYDRRGIGRSEFDGEPPTLAHVNETLQKRPKAVEPAWTRSATPEPTHATIPTSNQPRALALGIPAQPSAGCRYLWPRFCAAIETRT
jgi:pimeloyl-ACP methyl ester carboxylesterase